MLVLIFCLLSRVYGLQNGQTTIPAVLNSVGVGYNILRGNPDGADWRYGGDDPGLLVTRRILKLESESGSVPDQMVYVRHDSCQSSTTDRLIYSPKTYQAHLGHRITFAGTSLPSLQASAFTLSTGYLSVKKETDTLHYVLQDRTSTCVNGTARYTLNLASANFYHLTDEFMSDVCSLPEVFDADSYTRFLDRWGTVRRNKSFWPTVKPFLTNKGTNVKKYTILLESDTLVNDQSQVCDISNDFFVNVGKDIGHNSIQINEDHPSLKSIKKNIVSEDSFCFSPLDNLMSACYVCSQIDSIY